MSSLSILIPSLSKREALLQRLLSRINSQTKTEYDLEVLLSVDNGQKKIGAKRNELIAQATKEYVCFIDDDDDISNDYLEQIFTAISSGCDVVGLHGTYYYNGVDIKDFIHSIQNERYLQTQYFIYRPPNHLNPMKAEIAKQYLFLESNFGEDTEWSMRLCADGCLKTEFMIDKSIYKYYYISQK